MTQSGMCCLLTFRPWSFQCLDVLQKMHSAAEQCRSEVYMYTFCVMISVTVTVIYCFTCCDRNINAVRHLKLFRFIP